MRLREALEIINRIPESRENFPVLLACGFTPLHLSTFLAAHLQLRRPEPKIDLWTGLYGDLVNTVSSVPGRKPNVALVMLEWGDLDPRLGLRQLGSWSPAALPGIVETVQLRLQTLRTALSRAAKVCRVVLCPPLLEPAPVFYTVRPQMNPYAARLRADMAVFVAQVAEEGVVLLDSAHLPAMEHFDFLSELATGFPLQVAFAEQIAATAAQLLLPAVPKKGLITDLDDTLWRGLLGEIGASGVKWDLDGKAQVHGIYQTLLQSLADAGVLVAVCSKNEPANVREAFQRPDLRIAPERLFPLEVGWGRKSEAVGRILDAWNVSADSVVFVDDSPLELAEVAEAHPGITTLAFPPKDANAAWLLFGQLRDLFGKENISEEDKLRLESLRTASEWKESLAAPGAQRDDFLAKAEAILQVEYPLEAADTRALELVNKTNQFNLNGRRRTEAEWRRLASDPAGVALAVSYQDKFGPLGKIAVLAGERGGATLRLHTWVMSCRAFSRNIEHRCLRYLFDQFGFDRIELAFEATTKNGVLREFLRDLEEEPNVITRASFSEQCPPLYHTVREITHDRS